MRLIGIAGQMQSGKDTVADRLKLVFNDLNWNRFAFASPLKQTYCNSFSVDRDFIEKWKTRTDYPPNMEKTVREGMQFIGDGFRQIMPNIWIMKVFQHIKQYEPQDQNFIISDIRYLNEARAIKDAGGLVMLVWRKDRENNVDHKSEQEVKPMVDWCRDLKTEGLIDKFECPLAEKNLFDIFIRNDDDLESLHGKVDTWLVKYVSQHFNLG